MAIDFTEKPPLKEAMDLIDEMGNDELHLLLDYLRTVVINRKQVAGARNYASLRVDDRVKITGNIKPLYLRGLRGTVIEKRRTRIVIRLDRGPVKKFRDGVVICPPTALTKVED